MPNPTQVNLNDEISDELPIPNLPVSLPNTAVPTQSADSLFPDGMPSWLTQNNPLEQSITTTPMPLVNTIKESKGKPGWWKTLAHNFAEYNIEIQAGSFLKGALAFDNPLKEETPEDWTAFTPEALQDFPIEYWPHLTGAQGPKDLAARQEASRQQMAEDAYFDQGSFSAKLAGGILGGLSSPTSLSLLKLASTMKYATVSQNVMMNALRTSPAIAAESFARNSLMQANREGGSLDNTLSHTLVDTVLGVGLVSVGTGIGAAYTNAKLFNSKRLMQMSLEGIDAKAVVTEDGVMTGKFKASPLPGYNLSAAEVDVAQTYLDEAMAKGGILSTPWLGEGIKKMLSIPGLQSPALRAMRSPYGATKNWFNRLVGSPFVTEKEQAGRAVPDSAVQIADSYAAQALNFTLHYRNKFYEANGIEGNDAAIALKNIKQVITKRRQISNDDFGKEVRRVMYDKDYQSPWRQAHEAADASHDLLEQMNTMYSQLTGRPMFKDPRTAWRYLPQNDHIPQMIAREDEWHEITASELLKQDNRILDLQRPIETTNARMTDLKEQINSLKEIDPGNPLVPELEKQVSAARRMKRKQHDEMVKTILDSDDDHLLLLDRVVLNSDERDTLNSILEPLTTEEKNQASLNKKLRKLKVQADKDPVAIRALEAKITQAESDIVRIKKQLSEDAHAGKIDNKFFEHDGYDISFHDPYAPIRFRPVYATDDARLNQAKQWYAAKMNMTPQDIIHSVLGDMTGDRGMPSYFKERSVMIPSEVYNEAGFLDPDIPKTITAYMQSVGRVFGFKTAFPEFAVGHDFSGVLKGLSQEHEKRKALVLKDKRTAARDKELVKMDKEFKSDLKFMQDTYNLYMGRFSSDTNPAFSKGAGIFKNLVAGTKLGAVPIYQLSDAAGIIMKQGLLPFLSMGLKPLLQSMNGAIKGPNAEAWIENAAHALVGLNGVQNGYAQKFFNSLSMSEPPVGGAFGGALEKISTGSKNFAQWSGNFFGINAIANVNERIAAGAFQSEVMNAAFAFKKGTLTAAQKTKMARYGIQIEDWADRFIKGYKESEGWKVGRSGYQSQYFKWTDHEAVARMSMSIRRAVHDSVVNGNIFQSPLWSNSPLGSMVFMFHGWAYNAFNRYTVPLLQRPDAEHILGAMFLVGFSMMADPLLRMANGKEPFKDDATWFDASLKGLEYSGLLGPTWEVLANINKGMGYPVFPAMQTERSKGYNKWGAFAGPVAGMIMDIADVTGHGIKGNLTQGDARKAARMTPLLGHVLLRGQVNKFIESSGLPASRKGTEPWMWRKYIYGDENDTGSDR